MVNQYTKQACYAKLPSQNFVPVWVAIVTGYAKVRETDLTFRESKSGDLLP